MMVQEIDLMRTLERMELQIEQLTDNILCYGIQRASASLQCQMDRNTLERLRNLKKTNPAVEGDPTAGTNYL